MDIKQAIANIVRKQDLTTEQMAHVLGIIMDGEATPAQIGGLLIGLRRPVRIIAAVATDFPAHRRGGTAQRACHRTDRVLRHDTPRDLLAFGQRQRQP